MPSSKASCSGRAPCAAPASAGTPAARIVDRPVGPEIVIALLRRYLPRYRWPLLLVIVLLFVQAVGTLYLPELNAEIINEGVVTGDTDVILRTGAVMLAVSLVLMAAAIVGVYYSARVAMGFGRDVRSAIFRSVESFSQADVNHFGTATLITRNTNDVQQVQQVLLMALTMMITAPILLVGGLIMALRQDVPLSGVLLVIIPILVLIIALVMRRAIPLFGALQRRTDHINLVMREKLTGIRVIRAFVRTGHEERRFDAANRDYMATALSLNRLFAITMPALMLLMNLSFVAVLYLGAFRVESGEMPIGNLTAFLQYIMQILMAIMTAVLMLVVVPRAAVSGGRIQEVLDTEPSIQDPIKPHEPRPARPRGAAGRHLRLSRRRGAGAAGCLIRGPPGRDDRHRGLHRQRQDHARQPLAAPLRRDRGRRARGRRGRP